MKDRLLYLSLGGLPSVKATEREVKLVLRKGKEMQRIDGIETELIVVSQIIGSIHESNCHYTHGLAEILAKIDKPIRELTIMELIELHSHYNKKFNEKEKENENSH